MNECIQKRHRLSHRVKFIWQDLFQEYATEEYLEFWILKKNYGNLESENRENMRSFFGVYLANEVILAQEDNFFLNEARKSRSTGNDTGR